MVSIESSKRYMLDATPELAVKKSRFTSHSDTPHIISLSSSYHSENLSRLRLLFPFKPMDDLSKILTSASGNYEYAIFLVQKQEEDRAKKVTITKNAQEMVVALTSAQDIQQAVDIAINYLEKSQDSNKERAVIEENQALRNHASTLTKENKLLKKAVLKLHESAVNVLGKDQEIEKLSKELENERIKTYDLSIQFSQAINRRMINPSRELF